MCVFFYNYVVDVKLMLGVENRCFLLMGIGIVFDFFWFVDKCSGVLM